MANESLHRPVCLALLAVVIRWSEIRTYPVLIKFVQGCMCHIGYATPAPVAATTSMKRRQCTEQSYQGATISLFFSSKSVLVGNRAVLQLRCTNVTEKFDLTKKQILNIAKYKIRHLGTMHASCPYRLRNVS